jgi:hypothetical protein
MGHQYMESRSERGLGKSRRCAVDVGSEFLMYVCDKISPMTEHAGKGVPYLSASRFLEKIIFLCACLCV